MNEPASAPDSIFHPADPAVAFRMGTLLAERKAIDAELNALTSAEAKRLKLPGSGRIAFVTDTGAWAVHAETGAVAAHPTVLHTAPDGSVS